MLIDTLNDEQRRVLLSAMKRMMVADSRVRREELTLYSLMREDMGLDLEVTASESYGELDLSAFDTIHSQKILVFALGVMANADGDLHRSESALLKDVLERFYIPDEELQELQELARDQGALIERLVNHFKPKDER